MAKYSGGTVGKQKIQLYPVLRHIATGQKVTLEKPLTLNVQIISAKPAVTVTASGKLDTIVSTSAITYTIKKLTNISGVPTDVRLEGTGAERFAAQLNEDGQAVVTLNRNVPQEKGKSYKLQLVFTIAGQEVSAAVTVKVNQSSLKFASLKPVNLYQSGGYLACFLKLSAPSGAKIQSITIADKTPKQFINAVGSKDALAWTQMNDGTVFVSFRNHNPGCLTFGKSYTVILDVIPEGNAANVKPTQVKLTVKMFK